MPRDLSPELEAIIDAEDTESQDVLDITLPAAVGDANSLILHLGTGHVIVTIDTVQVEYLPKIRSMFPISYTRGGIPDGGEFTIANLANTYGPMFLTASRVLDGSEVIVRRVFRRAVPAGGPETDWLQDIIGSGILRTRPLTAGEVRAAFVPDMSNPMVTIGGYPLTQRCLHVFNVNGNHPQGGPCGWQVAQGGDPLVCDKVFDSAGGCAGHNNKHRFGGVPALTPNAQAAAGLGSIIGGRIIDPNGGFGFGRYPVKLFDFDPDNRQPFG